MLYNLNKDNNLKGYGFEYIIRILLRRKRKNNKNWFILAHPYLRLKSRSISDSHYRINFWTCKKLICDLKITVFANLLANNFIFQSIRFSNLKEIVDKYKLVFPENIRALKNFISENWNKFDLIEFELNNVKQRLVKSIKVYDVKTQNFNSKRKYLDVCKSNYDFFVKLNTLFDIKAQIIKTILFADWQFEVIIKDYDLFSIKIYSRCKI